MQKYLQALTLSCHQMDQICGSAKKAAFELCIEPCGRPLNSGTNFKLVNPGILTNPVTRKSRQHCDHFNDVTNTESEKDVA